MGQMVDDAYSYALVRVIDDIYEGENLDGIIDFIASLAVELTGGKGSTIRVLEQGSFNLELLSSYGLSEEYLESGAIDKGRSAEEITHGDIIVINDFENDNHVINKEAAKKEGINSVIGIPFIVNDTTSCILRVYYASRKIPTHEEMDLLNSLGKLCCFAIEHTILLSIRKEEQGKKQPE